ncbi:MAG: hypothetical protein ACJ787_21190 [Myxococcales bacterium]
MAAARGEREHPFPRARWAALLWLLVWIPVYASVWGFANFLHLCDVAVILTCAGLWTGSALLLSSQAVSSLVTDLLWDIDAGSRLLAGTHVFGGTEYLFDPSFPLAVRLLSLFHVVWPALLLWSLGRVGYDRRGFPLQVALASVLLVGSRFAGPALNLNYAFRDPIFHRSFGPAPVHLAVSILGLAALIYLPAHLGLARLFPREQLSPSR